MSWTHELFHLMLTKPSEVFCTQHFIPIALRGGSCGLLCSWGRAGSEARALLSVSELRTAPVPLAKWPCESPLSLDPEHNFRVFSIFFAGYSPRSCNPGPSPCPCPLCHGAGAFPSNDPVPPSPWWLTSLPESASL